MRGRLINPFLAEIARLDTSATATTATDGGGFASGYDSTFREPRAVKVGGRGGAGAERRDSRRELAPIRIRTQVEPDLLDQLRQFSSGNSPRVAVALLFHCADLEGAGLIDSVDGSPLIRVNDRLVALWRVDGVSLVQRFDRVPAYATRVESRGVGLGGYRNLVMALFEERAKAQEQA